MISIPEKVDEIITSSPYFREAVTSGVANLSALAREIKPQVEKELLKPASQSAVLIALQRYAQTHKPYYAANPGHFLGNLTLRSDLFEITVRNSAGLTKKLSSIMQLVEQDRSIMFVFTQGIHETTVIGSKSLRPTVEKLLGDEDVTQTIEGLTALSLQRMHEHIEAVGVLMYPLRVIAWQGISVIEIVTTLNELMIVIRDKDVDRAVVAVHKALKDVSEQEKTGS